MNKNRTESTGLRSGKWLLPLLICACFTSTAANAAVGKKMRPSPTPAGGAPCSSIETLPMIHLTLGKSFAFHAPTPVKRIMIGSPGNTMATGAKEKIGGAPGQPAAASAAGAGVASVDVVLLSPSELYLQGKSVGSTNLVLLGSGGRCSMVDIAVGIDSATAQAAINQMEGGASNRVKVTSAGDSLILSGTVADAVAIDKAVSLASVYAGQGKIVNMLNVADPQQVMLEVKVAEVSKTLLDELGFNTQIKGGGQWTYNLLSAFSSTGNGVLNIANAAGTRLFRVDAERDNGLVKMLAEPNVMAMSGQEGSFLAGGRIFIPVAQSGTLGGVSTITLEEKEFGVGLKFTPTVLDGGRINLVVAPEVSELSPNGVTIGSLFSSSTLPFMTTRRAKTTVQLNDGQSLAIGGLIKNNVTQSINTFPILGEIPILGALFRSSNFRTDKSELLFVITPHLVKPLPANYKLPTDNFIEPSRAEFFLGGKMEGSHQEPTTAKPADQATPAAPASGAPTGFEVK